MTIWVYMRKARGHCGNGPKAVSAQSTRLKKLAWSVSGRKSIQLRVQSLGLLCCSGGGILEGDVAVPCRALQPHRVEMTIRGGH